MMLLNLLHLHPSLQLPALLQLLLLLALLQQLLQLLLHQRYQVQVAYIMAHPPPPLQHLTT